MKKTEASKYYLAAAVSIVTFAVYLSALQNEFIVWDDDLYVYENFHIRSLNPAFFRWAFFDFHASNWHPLTWISHALDYAVWGLNPMGHHLTNNILHSVSAFVVVFLIIRLLDVVKVRTIQSGQSGFLDDRTIMITAGVTGFLFGLHPVHVESVAWVSERKDLLCALFFLLSIMAYTKYAGSQGAGVRGQGSESNNKHYLLSLGFFILALLSKPMAITLPAVLLLLDWYPLERVRSFKAFRDAIVEKLPFIALSLASSILTVLAQRAGNALASVEAAPLSMRVFVGVKSLASYLWKTVLPVNLIPFYPYPKDVSFLSLEYVSSMILVSGITITCIIMAKKQRLWLLAWGYYVITLLPALGIVQVGSQSMADRYMYLPGLGPFLIIGLMSAWAWARINRLDNWSLTVKSLSAAAAILMFISLSYLSFKQIGIWKNSVVFWSYVIEKEPERVPVAYYNRGITFEKIGQSDRAIEDYNKAIALKPSYYEAYNNRGLSFQKMGLLDKAIKDLEVAMAMNPSSPEAYNNLGKIYRKTGQFDRAMENYNRAIALNPLYHEAYYNRAIVYEKTGRLDAAIENYNKAIVLNPSYYEAYNNLGVLYGNAGLFDKAIENISKAILLNQSQAGSYLNRGTLYFRVGNKELAVSDLQKACDLGDKAGCSALDALTRGQTR